jgi:uncharacterized membrane protein YqjE
MADYTEMTHPGGTRSAAEIVQSVVRDIQEIVRSEVQLAKAEVSEKTTQMSGAAAMFGGAVAAGLLGGIALVAALVAFLAIWLPVWGAALIVGAVLTASAAILFLAGKGKLAGFTPIPRQTVETIKEDVEWAKQRTR